MNCLKKTTLAGVVVDTCNLSTWHGDAGGV